MMKLPVSLLAVGLLCASACYSYVPVGIETVAPGENVRAVLTSAAADGLAESLRDGRSVVGELVDRDDGSLILSVPSAVRRQGFYSEDLHERVVLRSTDVLDLESRQLNRTRTYLAAGTGAVAVITVAVWTLTGKAGGNTREGTDMDSSAGLISLFRIHVP